MLLDQKRRHIPYERLFKSRKNQNILNTNDTFDKGFEYHLFWNPACLFPDLSDRKSQIPFSSFTSRLSDSLGYNIPGKVDIVEGRKHPIKTEISCKIVRDLRIFFRAYCCIYCSITRVFHVFIFTARCYG